ncbi:MAG: hypothetical protein H7Z40_20855 [Phycisphaerae bacterium]|nr:hypothetical protein [Gemmatimonadaceae bacterium]
MRAPAVFLMALAALACSTKVKPAAQPVGAPPAFLLGNFEDDYGARFTISDTDFFQRARNHFRIVRWDVANQFLIAQNDSANPSDANQWTRIDWMRLNGMPPFDWAFCFTAYKSPTRARAESTAAANRETPRTGCNGFPFSRMKRTP